MKSLVEINLRKNKIHTIKDLQGLNSLQKLYLSNNNIQSIEAIKELPALQDMTVENNPVEKQSKLPQYVKEKFPSLVNLNLQKIQNLLLEDSEEKKKSENS